MTPGCDCTQEMEKPQGSDEYSLRGTWKWKRCAPLKCKPYPIRAGVYVLSPTHLSL